MQNIAIIDFNSDVEIGTSLMFRRNSVPLWFPFDQMSYLLNYPIIFELQADYLLEKILDNGKYRTEK